MKNGSVVAGLIVLVFVAIGTLFFAKAPSAGGPSASVSIEQKIEAKNQEKLKSLDVCLGILGEMQDGQFVSYLWDHDTAAVQRGLTALAQNGYVKGFRFDKSYLVFINLGQNVKLIPNPAKASMSGPTCADRCANICGPFGTFTPRAVAVSKMSETLYQVDFNVELVIEHEDAIKQMVFHPNFLNERHSRMAEIKGDEIRLYKK